MPTPLAPGVEPPGIPSSSVTKGPGTKGLLLHPPPMPGLIVSGESIYVPNLDCFDLIRRSLDTHAPVQVSDPVCEKSMNEALELQRTRPEPTQ